MLAKPNVGPEQRVRDVQEKKREREKTMLKIRAGQKMGRKKDREEETKRKGDRPDTAEQMHGSKVRARHGDGGGSRNGTGTSNRAWSIDG